MWIEMSQGKYRLRIKRQGDYVAVTIWDNEATPHKEHTVLVDPKEFARAAELFNY